MAKKTAKLTREQVYREILGKDGIRFEDCRVLSFVFQYPRWAERFHFDLMAQKSVYFLFDSWEKYANVIVPNNEQNAAVIIAIAENNGGEKTTPNLI